MHFSKCKTHACHHRSFQCGLQNGRTCRFMRHSESLKYVSISFYFDFYFTNSMQKYPTMSRQHCGKKLLVNFTQNAFQDLDIRTTWSWKFQNLIFLFPIMMLLLLWVTCIMIGKSNCHIGNIKLSTILTMFILNFCYCYCFCFI